VANKNTYLINCTGTEEAIYRRYRSIMLVLSTMRNSLNL